MDGRCVVAAGPGPPQAAPQRTPKRHAAATRNARTAKLLAAPNDDAQIGHRPQRLGAFSVFSAFSAQGCRPAYCARLARQAHFAGGPSLSDSSTRNGLHARYAAV